MAKPICIYHAKCADGFTSAWVVQKVFGEEIDFHPGVYGEAPPDVSGRDVYLVDFSYKRPVLEQMAEEAITLTILDHHKTAAADLDGMGKRPHVDLVFDMNRSGARIAWEYFHDGPIPNLVAYVEDRDLWRFALPFSREVSAFIFAHEYTFENWDHLDRQMRTHMDIQRIAEMGGAIEKKHHKDVAELVSVCRRKMMIGGHAIPVANLPYTLTSDAGHLMAQGEPFAACYWDTPDGRVFSLRSADDGLDVSEIAKAYGGGGHAKASGFKMPIGWEGE